MCVYVFLLNLGRYIVLEALLTVVMLVVVVGVVLIIICTNNNSDIGIGGGGQGVEVKDAVVAEEKGDE